MKGRITVSSVAISLITTIVILQAFVGCSSDVNYSPPSGSTDTAITHYSFGKLVVDGKTFEADVMILPVQMARTWKFGINHQLHPEDVQAITDGTVHKLIIGTGASEPTSVMDKTLDFLKSKGIEYTILNTYDAVRMFNTSPKNGLAAYFHINC